MKKFFTISIITDFGAKPDGITLNTRSIQAAIDLASADGGDIGAVHFRQLRCRL